MAVAGLLVFTSVSEQNVTLDHDHDHLSFPWPHTRSSGFMHCSTGAPVPGALFLGQLTSQSLCTSRHDRFNAIPCLPCCTIDTVNETALGQEKVAGGVEFLSSKSLPHYFTDLSLSTAVSCDSRTRTILEYNLFAS